MKTKNIDLINILLGLGINPNLLVDSFVIIGKLAKKFGKMLYTPQYIKQVALVSSDISNIISVLKYVDKTNYQEIKTLIKLTKTISKDYKPEFVITTDSNEHNDKLKQYVSQKFGDCKLDVNTTNKIGVNISGEGRYYKRDLESDLEKILR